MANRRKRVGKKKTFIRSSPAVARAKQYLEELYPSLVSKYSSKVNLCGIYPFNYKGISQEKGYVRYLFIEGTDERITYVVLTDEERENIIQLFTNKMKEKNKEYNNSFIYKGSLKGMFVGEEPKHRFYCPNCKTWAFMSDEGEISFPCILRDKED